MLEEEEWSYRLNKVIDSLTDVAKKSQLIVQYFSLLITNNLTNEMSLTFMIVRARTSISTT